MLRGLRPLRQLAYLCVSLMACHPRRAYAPPLPTVDGLRLAASSYLVGKDSDTVVVHVTVRNEARQPRSLEWGGCTPVIVRAQSPTDGSIRWDYGAWWRQSMSPLCLGGATERLLAAGEETLLRELRWPSRRILGDSLPPGRYRLTADAYLNGRSFRGLPAGALTLRLPPT